MKALHLLLWLALPAVVRAQSAEPVAAPVLRTAGAFFALSVADVPASAKWYREKLGLTVVMDAPKQNGAAVAVLEGGGLIVELVELDAAAPLSRAAPAAAGAQYVHGFFKAGVLVDDFDRTVATLRARGVEIAFGPFPARPNMRANAIIKDNAGNLIQLFGR